MGRKDDLIVQAEELGLEVPERVTIADLEAMIAGGSVGSPIVEVAAAIDALSEPGAQIPVGDGDGCVSEVCAVEVLNAVNGAGGEMRVRVDKRGPAGKFLVRER